mmetsp:Transcript_6711/g.13626  ORF Transcript_6711/g.13626 Transcript_6711/m.13626 type:complete len:204 (+) Transcript_6711:518-1129(+)
MRLSMRRFLRFMPRRCSSSSSEARSSGSTVVSISPSSSRVATASFRRNSCACRSNTSITRLAWSRRWLTEACARSISFICKLSTSVGRSDGFSPSLFTSWRSMVLRWRISNFLSMASASRMAAATSSSATLPSATPGTRMSQSATAIACALTSFTPTSTCDSDCVCICVKVTSCLASISSVEGGMRSGRVIGRKDSPCGLVVV